MTDTQDLIARLRSWKAPSFVPVEGHPMLEAADALESAQAEVARLRLTVRDLNALQERQAGELDAALARLAELEKANTVSDQDINLIAHNEAAEDWSDLTFRDGWFAGFKDGFRSAEVEHGIKERS